MLTCIWTNIFTWNKNWEKAVNNFYCDYILTGKRKIVTFDTKKAHFGLMFQTMNIAKTHEIASIFFKTFWGWYFDSQFVLSTTTGHRYHIFNYFILSIIPIRQLNHDNDRKVHFKSTLEVKTHPHPPPPIQNPGYGPVTVTDYKFSQWQHSMAND